MAEEYNICEIPKSDIGKYAEMVFALDIGHDDRAGEMREFLRNYGKDVKEIQGNLGKHLDECFLCGDYYKECLEDELLGNRYAKKMFLKEGIDMKAVDAGLEKKREWRIEHSAYENPDFLRRYLIKKACSFNRGENFETRLELEKHIESCNRCKELYNLELEINREIRKRLNR